MFVIQLSYMNSRQLGMFKNNFLFLRLKTCLVIQNGEKTKTVFKIQFMKETENMQKAVFSF